MILLQKEKLIFMRMNEYKSDEMAWLKFFIVWYTALCAYLLTDLPVKNINGLDPTSILLVVSQITTVAFVFLLWHIRKNYYEKHGEGFKIRQALDEIVQDFELDAEWAVNMDSTRWRLYTKPFNSFLMRLAFVVGANCTVFALAAFFKKITIYEPVVVVGGAVLSNIILMGAVFFLDLHHFVKKRR